MKRNGTTNGKNLPPMNREPPRILALGGMERFAQRVEINRRPSSFNGPSPSATLPTTPPFLQRLGINPGFLWGDYWNYYTPAKWNRTELSDVDRGGVAKGGGGRRGCIEIPARNRVFRVSVRVPRAMNDDDDDDEGREGWGEGGWEEGWERLAENNESPTGRLVATMRTIPEISSYRAAWEEGKLPPGEE